MDLEEIGINAGNWVDSTQDALLESLCVCGIEPSGLIHYGVLWLILGEQYTL